MPHLINQSAPGRKPGQANHAAGQRHFQRKIGIDFVCKLGGKDCLTADLDPRVNGYSPWTLIICLRVGDIIAHCAEEMGKGKPGNLTAHLFRHNIRVPEVEANPNARVYQLVHGCSMVLKLRVMGGLALLSVSEKGL